MPPQGYIYLVMVADNPEDVHYVAHVSSDIDRAIDWAGLNIPSYYDVSIVGWTIDGEKEED